MSVRFPLLLEFSRFVNDGDSDVNKTKNFIVLGSIFYFTFRTEPMFGVIKYLEFVEYSPAVVSLGIIQ